MATKPIKPLLALAALSGVAALAAAGFVWSGVYDIGADTPHTRPVYRLLEITRERSIEARAASLQVPPDLDDTARVVQGAGNYQAMCTGCHLAPGMAPTELSQGLYPAPPDLTRHTIDAAKAFWTVKHGIKSSGMPAWGKSMQDEYIWDITAFLQRLPGLSASEYNALVAQSSGHSHGGGESMHASGNAEAPDTDHPHTDAAPHAHDAEKTDARKTTSAKTDTPKTDAEPVKAPPPDHSAHDDDSHQH